MSDLRESGQIEQDADMVWFIHRDMTRNEIEKDPNKNYTAELIIAKFRNGQPGSLFLGWDGTRTSFYNLERDANEQSIVNAYEKKKKSNESIETIKDKLSSVINQINSDFENNAAIKENLNENYNPENYDDFSTGDIYGLMPPPAQSEDLNFSHSFGSKDFSDINIDDEDELY